MIRLRQTLLLILWLAGCTATGPVPEAPAPRAAGPGDVRVYACGEIDVVVDLRDESAWLFLPAGTYQLQRQGSGPEVHFSDGTHSFLAHGEEAVIETPDRNYPDCRHDRMRSIWEDAKLRGVDFRAVGNEPGWLLEIGPEATLLVLDYGDRELTYPTPEPVSDQASRTTRYNTDVDGQAITITLEAKPCRDTMVEEDYETTVTVTVGERVYWGCGRPLH